MSVIKKDGGGTQYTFMEAEYHDCCLILHKEWCNVKGSLYRDNKNCYAVENEIELKDALLKTPIKSNVLPTQKENNLWDQIIA